MLAQRVLPLGSCVSHGGGMSLFSHIPKGKLGAGICRWFTAIQRKNTYFTNAMITKAATTRAISQPIPPMPQIILPSIIFDITNISCFSSFEVSPPACTAITARRNCRLHRAT